MKAGLDKRAGLPRWGFVVPRYGASIGGGAETLVRELAEQLARRGDHVEVFSTTALDNRTWANALPAGTSQEGGVEVHRFNVDERNLDKWVPLQIRLSEGLRLSVEEQLDWMAEGVNSHALYNTLAQRASEFDALFFAPYLFGTTFFGSLAVTPRAILIPCLHDEAYAYLEVIQSMFRHARGCLFNAAPEQELARRLYGHLPGGEVGMGFEPFSAAYIAALEPFFEERFPYVLYLGRKETGKNAHVLIDYFIALKERAPSDLKLVVAGGGSFTDLEREGARARSDIIDINHVSERDKHRLLRHAEFLCQPSRNESFSIVLMESWLLGTPVVVHAGCAVTRTHCIEGGGGLYFADEGEFCAVALSLRARPDLRNTLAQQGERFVKRKYSWSAVRERFDQVTHKILNQEACESVVSRSTESKNIGHGVSYGT